MTPNELKAALADGRLELPYAWTFHAQRHPEDDFLAGEQKPFFYGQPCQPLRLSRSGKALLVTIREEQVGQDWRAPSPTAGGGGIFRDWYSWLHAD